MIKSILVHLAEDDRHLDRLQTAIDLARAFNAHVDIVYVTYPVALPAGAAGRAASHAFMADRIVSIRKQAEALESELQENFADCSDLWTYHVEDGNHHEVMRYHAHLSDLVIVGQSADTYLEDRLRMRLPDHLLLTAGCPVLVLPTEKKPDAPSRAMARLGVPL